MLILILNDIQHSQKVVSSFEKSSSWQNHSFSGSLHPLKNPTSKVSNSPHPTGKNLPSPTPYHYLENPALVEQTFCQLKKVVLLRIFQAFSQK